jgi:hypothetical protein
MRRVHLYRTCLSVVHGQSSNGLCVPVTSLVKAGMKRLWSDGDPIDPSPTVDQAINGGYPWLEIACSRCKANRDVDLAALPHVSTTFVRDLGSRLVCQKCKGAGKRPPATLLQLMPRSRHSPE